MPKKRTQLHHHIYVISSDLDSSSSSPLHSIPILSGARLSHKKKMVENTSHCEDDDAAVTAGVV